jgi:protein EFR3
MYLLLIPSDIYFSFRTRLIGLAALKGVVNSEALYNDSGQFRVQVSTIIRPLLVTLLQAEIHILNDQ